MSIQGKDEGSVLSGCPKWVEIQVRKLPRQSQRSLQGVNKMVWQVKALATKHARLNSFPRSLMVEGENQYPQDGLWPLCTHIASSDLCIHTYTASFDLYMHSIL